MFPKKGGGGSLLVDNVYDLIYYNVVSFSSRYITKTLGRNVKEGEIKIPVLYAHMRR